MKRALLSLLLLSAAGCATAKATQWHTPKERTAECRQVCGDLGLRLSAVVVIMSNAGCVCTPAESTEAEAGAATAAGGAAIQATVEASRRSSGK